MLGDGDCHECDDDDGDDASLHPLSRRIRSPVNHPPRVKNPHLIAHDFGWHLRVPHDKAHLETHPRPLTPSPPTDVRPVAARGWQENQPAPSPPGNEILVEHSTSHKYLLGFELVTPMACMYPIFRWVKDGEGVCHHLTTHTIAMHTATGAFIHSP